MYRMPCGTSGTTEGDTYSYVGIFGCNVRAVMGCALHANNFVGQNIPLGAGTLPPGAFYYCVVGGQKQIFMV